jgi:hypothetical protein
MRAGEPSDPNRVVPPHPVMAWAESDQGAIARGIVDAFYEGGAHVSLDGALEVGDDIAVRIAFGPGTPTLPASGRVVSVNAEGDQLRYALEWTSEGKERVALEEQIARLGTVH